LKTRKCNKSPYIEEEQTTQWSKGKGQKDKQRSTTQTHKTRDRVSRSPLKAGGELRCSRRVSSSCSTSGIRRVNLETCSRHDIAEKLMSWPHSVTLSWFQPNQSLLFLFYVVCLSEKQQMPINSLWFDPIGNRTHDLQHSRWAR
jgi:hypothetical protein